MNEKPTQPRTFNPDDMSEEELDAALESAGITRELLGERNEQTWALAARLQAADIALSKGKLR